MKSAYLGIDVGSISTNLVLMDEKNKVIEQLYLYTNGAPIQTVITGLRELRKNGYDKLNIIGCGVTGSARKIIGIMAGADIVKNEITAHALAALSLFPDVQTVLEIGGQDSKIIIIRDGVVVDFGMNAVCAAGTGSFLDSQASRLKIPIEEFGEIALKSKNPVQIAGRCTVFAESDMIHKQQIGHREEDIINGLCFALVRNYLANVAKGKEIKPPILFQGGVSENKGLRAAFQQELNENIIVPEYNKVMGALGCCLLAKRLRKGKSHFKGFYLEKFEFHSTSFQCRGCSNLCEIIEAREKNQVISRWGGRCGKWDQ